MEENENEEINNIWIEYAVSISNPWSKSLFLLNNNNNNDDDEYNKEGYIRIQDCIQKIKELEEEFKDIYKEHL